MFRIFFEPMTNSRQKISSLGGKTYSMLNCFPSSEGIHVVAWYSFLVVVLYSGNGSPACTSCSQHLIPLASGIDLVKRGGVFDDGCNGCDADAGGGLGGLREYQ